MFFAHVNMKEYLPWADVKSESPIHVYDKSEYMKEYLSTQGTKKLLWFHNERELESYLSKNLSSEMKTDEVLESYLVHQWVPVLPGWHITYTLS